MNAVIETEALRKDYRRLRGGATTAVDGLDLTVPAGGVFGFLGPNGSGKTTTIRCLLGLVRPTSGAVRLLGATPAELSGVIGRVGAIVETPTFFPTMSARTNLALLARIAGSGAGRVDAALERVGLAGRADDLVKNYSLGMKQRLGLAAALLKDPELLILDEPANGLDPAGIKEVRQLIRALGDEGRTVFLSSHLLGEIQQVCDRVAILARGRCIAAGAVADVLSRGAPSGHVVRVTERTRGVEVLRAAGYTVRVDAHDGSLHVTGASGDGARITETLAGAGLYLSELRAEEASLEDVFLELTGGDAP